MVMMSQNDYDMDTSQDRDLVHSGCKKYKFSKTQPFLNKLIVQYTQAQYSFRPNENERNLHQIKVNIEYCVFWVIDLGKS